MKRTIMRLGRRLALLAMAPLSSGPALAAEPTPAEPVRFVVEGDWATYDVAESQDGKSADVVTFAKDDGALLGSVSFVLNEDGSGTYSATARSGEKLRVLANGVSGKVFEGSAVVASWETDEHGEVHLAGFDAIYDNPALHLILDSGSDAKIGGTIYAGWLPILIPLAPIYLYTCISSCQCCEDFYAGNPPPGTPEPTCCARCFSPACLDFS